MDGRDDLTEKKGFGMGAEALFFMRSMPKKVIPAKAGIHVFNCPKGMDSHLRGNDLCGIRDYSHWL